MRTLCVGDIHGGLKALQQVLERSKFDNDNDRLITLGDYVDGWTESKGVIDLLLTIKNLIPIIGNHDSWLLDWMTTYRAVEWASQGGDNTFLSYVPKSHIDFLKRCYAYYHDEEKNRLYVHGGFDIKEENFSKQRLRTLMWDRHLVDVCKMNNKHYPDKKYGGFDEIYVGHTSTTYTLGTTVPTKLCNLWMIDTGGGFEGKLTIMDVDTKEYFQSDYVHTLYPDTEHGKHAAK